MARSPVEEKHRMHSQASGQGQSLWILFACQFASEGDLIFEAIYRFQAKWLSIRQ